MFFENKYNYRAGNIKLLVYQDLFILCIYARMYTHIHIHISYNTYIIYNTYMIIMKHKIHIKYNTYLEYMYCS